MTSASAGYRWNLVLLLASAQAIAYIDRVNFAVVAPQLISDHGYTPTQVGVLLSTFNWAFMLSLLAAGPLVDRIRPRRSFPIGVGGWSLATGLCSLTQAFFPLSILRAFVGVGESLMIPSGSRVIRETFEQKRRALAVGFFFAGNRIGLTIGIPLSSVLLVHLGWPWVFYVTGSLGILWLLWWFAVYRPPPDPPREDADRHEAQERIRWITLLKYPTTWGVMLGQGGYLYIYFVFANWLPSYLVLQRGMSILRTGWVGMLPFLVGTLCVVLGGWAGDRLIRAGYRVTLVRKGFAVSGLFGATLFTVAGAYALSDVLAVVLLTLAVASASFATAAVNSMPLDVAPPHIVSSLVSLQNFGGNVGGSFAPLVTGLLVTATGDFTVPLLVAAGVALVFGCGSYGLIVGNLDHELRVRTPSSAQ